MPTITIDLPDNLNVPANWDARAFFATKLYEAGFLSSVQVAQTAGVSPKTCVEPVEDSVPEEETKRESWFTPEQRAQFRENRRRLEEEAAKNPRTEEEWEEYYQFILNGPVADEEEIQALEEIQEMRRRWVSPW